VSLLLALACLLAPVDGVVVDAFRPPACAWCPGNRGLEIRTLPGATVRAAADGVVGYAGTVAGVRYVVVVEASGRRTTYGRLRSVHVRAGSPVRAGDPVGTAGGLVFFGVRVGDDYVDPDPLLGEPAYHPQLVPLDGGRRRPGRPPGRSCPSGGSILDRPSQWWPSRHTHRPPAVASGRGTERW
jgi:murein DD-endopeptidase MepM/ murein hydrolase activator NlpD